MARALYDPERGYYTKQIRSVGSRGDFSTSATLSPLLGEAIAAWLREEHLSMPQVQHIIEVGAGDGSLMQTVRQALGWWTRRRFQFHIVETSPVLRALQQERLGRAITWHETMEAALEAVTGKAFIYHNEVLDAFPVTLIQWHDQAWQEVFVTRDASGRVAEEWHPLEPHCFSSQHFVALREWLPPPQPRQRVELHTSVQHWMQQWTPLWQTGAMLAMDYGDIFPALYHRRPMGTLRAYLLQQRLTGAAVYENIGRQDLTADVNFSDYRAWACELGCEELGYGTQTDFITARVKALGNHAANAFLLDEHGAGQAFKYVIHRRLLK